jgi:TPP-dependent trihydroxycyclohexane-1,2-dione (THcHDO) dehydratase
MPDETLVLIEYLEASDRLAQYALTIAEDLKGWHAPEKWITVQATGGRLEGVRTANPRVDVNVYAPSKPLAKRIALTAIAEIRSIKNFITSEAVVIKANPSWPNDLTDTVNSNPRYTFDVDFWLRPL